MELTRLGELLAFLLTKSCTTEPVQVKPRRWTRLVLGAEPRSFPLSSALSFLSCKVKKMLPSPA